MDLKCGSDSVLWRSGGSGLQSWGGRGSESAGGCSNMEEVRKIWRGETVDSFEGKEEYFVVDVICDGEPVQLL